MLRTHDDLNVLTADCQPAGQDAVLVRPLTYYECLRSSPLPALIALCRLPVLNDVVNFCFDTPHSTNDALNAGLQDNTLERFGDDIRCAQVESVLFSLDVGGRRHKNDRHMFERGLGFKCRENLESVVLRGMVVENNKGRRMTTRLL